MFIDTHAHLYSEYYSNPEKVLKDANANYIKLVISSGVDKQTNKELLDLSKLDAMYITLGIHPESVNDYEESDLNFIENNLSNPKVVAIGEIGLDYHYDGFDKEKQIKLFEDQLKIAEKNNFPVVVHSRDAFADTYNTLQKHKVTGVIHSFSGTIKEAREYINLGFKLGVNGIVTFNSSDIKDIIKETGLENWVLETDSPYLSPNPVRGTVNTPVNINYIAKFLSDYLAMSIKEISDVTNQNVIEIFDRIKV